MRVAGVLMLLGSAGCAVWLAFQNRNIVIRARVGNEVWTGHLYLVLVFGALLAAWFLLGIAFLVARRRPERRHARATRHAPVAAPRAQPYSPTTEYRRNDPSLYMQPGVRAPSK
jgi:hypothetical protein